MQSDSHGSEIADSLADVGITPTSITRITDAREPVYEVESPSGRRFVKLLVDEKGAAMRDVLERDLSVGMPDSTLVCDGTYALVMEPATGTALSLSLPACLLPGLWWTLSDSLSRAVREVGAGLGELHSGTHAGDRSADSDECRLADRLAVDRSVREHLSDGTVTRMRRLFDELREVRLPFARIHGDPTPHNIFWNVRTGAVTVIDFNLHRSVAVDDLVVFEAGVELMVDRLPYARQSQTATMIEAFRSAYADRGVHDSIPTRAIAIAKLSYYAHLLGKYLRGAFPDTRREKLTRYTDRRIAERRVESLVSQLC